MPDRVLTALPVYNEARHVGPVLDEVVRFSQDVLVVDDGSTDDTGARLAARGDVRVLTHGTNRGYGAALATAFDAAVAGGYDALVTIDCDGQHQPSLIPEIAAALDPDPTREPDVPPVDLVSGSRYLKTFAGDSAPPEDRRAINRRVTDLLNDRLGFGLTDGFCGFKAYRVLSLPNFDVTEFGYAMPLQLWVQAAAAGLRVAEFPVPLVYLEEERSFGGALDQSDVRFRHYLDVFERELARHPELSAVPA